MSEIIRGYFPSLSEDQVKKLARLGDIYQEWNSKINVISRRDIENFEIHHLLHSLAIAKVISFLPGTKILDAGTGGGFPGIPLAVVFPDSEFTLLDSIAKKIRVASAVAEELKLKNVTTIVRRAEDEKDLYDFVISRAVTTFHDFVKLTAGKVRKGGRNSLANGIICLKGGDLTGELKLYRDKVRTWDIKDYFSESFFETKKIVYLPV